MSSPAAVVGDNSGLAEKLGYLQNAVGGVLDPFSSFLTLRGIRTTALRMERHSANALQLAEWLEQQPEVERVWFPGWPRTRIISWRASKWPCPAA